MRFASRTEGLPPAHGVWSGIGRLMRQVGLVAYWAFIVIFGAVLAIALAPSIWLYRHRHLLRRRSHF